MCCTLIEVATTKFILVIVLRQLVTLRLHNRAVSRLVSRLASLGSLLETGLLGLRNANGLQPERTLEAFSSAAPGGEVNTPTASQANPGFLGLKTR
jgi:hypothetical protein